MLIKRISSTQQLYLLTTYLEQSLKEGYLIPFDELIKKLDAITLGKPLFKKFLFKKGFRLDVPTLQKEIGNIVADIEILYAHSKNKEEYIQFLSKTVDTLLSKLSYKVNDLEKRIGISDVTYPTTYYDLFNNLSKVDLENSNIDINLENGEVTLPTNANGATRIKMTHLVGINIPVNPVVSKPTLYSSSDKNLAFYKAFFEDSYWQHTIKTKTPQDSIQFSFEVPFNDFVFLNGISFTFLSEMSVEVYRKDDDYNFVKIPNVPTLKTETINKKIIFSTVRAKSLKFICTLPKIDDKFICMIKDLGFYSVGFQNTGVLTTKPILIPENSSELVLSLTGQTPVDTAILSYCKIDGKKIKLENKVPLSLGEKSIYDLIIDLPGKSTFESTNLYTTIQNRNFYFQTLETTPTKVSELRMGVNSFSYRNYDEFEAETTTNIFKPNTEINALSLYRTYKEVQNIEANDGTSGVNAIDYPLVLTLSQTAYSSTFSAISPAEDFTELNDETIILNDDNVSIFYVADTAGNIFKSSAIAKLEGNNKKLYFNTNEVYPNSSNTISASTKVTVFYKIPLTSKIVETSVQVFEDNVNDITDQITINYTTKQITFDNNIANKKITVIFKREYGNTTYNEYSTIFYTSKPIDTNLKNVPNLSTSDSLTLGETSLSAVSQKLTLAPGYYKFIYKTDSSNHLANLVNILKIKDNKNRKVFYNYFDSFQIELGKLTQVSLNTLLYNTYKEDTKYFAVSGNQIIFSFLPYYSTANPIISISEEDLDTLDLDDNKNLFYIQYNIVTNTEKTGTFIFELKGSKDTPILQSYEIYIR